MDVRTEISYPDATVDQVFALAVDPAFRAAVCEATMALDHSVDIRHDPDGSAMVTVSRTMPAAVPDFVRKLVGETIIIVQTEVWAHDNGSGRRYADLSLHVVSQPVTMTGSLLIESSGGGARELVQGDVKVSLPFIGRKVEGEIAKGVVAAARKEQQTGETWLAR